MEATTDNRWSQPVEVSDAQVAFPANLERLLPPMNEIPEELRYRSGTAWNRIVGRWFFTGLRGRFVWKEGIDGEAAMRHLRACMGSWEPKHEHKEAGVAYLLSLWADRFEPLPD